MLERDLAEAPLAEAPLEPGAYLRWFPAYTNAVVTNLRSGSAGDGSGPASLRRASLHPSTFRAAHRSRSAEFGRAGRYAFRSGCIGGCAAWFRWRNAGRDRSWFRCRPDAVCVAEGFSRVAGEHEKSEETKSLPECRQVLGFIGPSWPIAESRVPDPLRSNSESHRAQV